MKDKLLATAALSGHGGGRDDVALDKLFTVRDAAGHLTLAEKTLWAWIAARRIGVVRLGRAVRVPSSEVQRIISEGTTLARRSA